MPPSDSTAPAADFSFVEGDDAGEQLSGATPIFADLMQPLTSISGTLSGDADLFQIYISGDQPFSATTLSPATLLGLPIDNALGIPNPLLEDPQLFLFDAAGNGVYGNDDLFGSPQATLPSMMGLLNPGVYYLAISGFDYDPISMGGDIFLDGTPDGVLFPTEPGGDLPLTGFAGESAIGGNYTIALTGAQTIQTAAQPMAFDLLGLIDTNQIVAFSTSSPAQTTTLPVTGIEGDLIGIDVRPANGLIYGLTTANQIYTIALGDNSAEATLVSALSQPFEGGTVSGFDFNPVADRLRLVGDNDQDFRINVDTGAVTVDGDLAFAPEDVNAGVNPSVTGAAYTNSFAGTTATQLYDIDNLLDSLLLQNPPNDGTLQTVGPLGFDTGIWGGFDIVSSSAGDNTAFLVSNATLYTLDLASGAATNLGAVGDDSSLSFQGLTAAPTVAVPLPELVDLTGFDGNVTVNAIQQLSREAFFDNVLAFYETDARGQVNGLLPGDPGYEAAAATNLIDGIRLTVGNNQIIDAALSLQGGTYYAPALLIDGSLQNLATVGDAALGQRRIQREGNTWQFEDAGDFDFNDLIVTLTPEVGGIA